MGRLHAQGRRGGGMEAMPHHRSREAENGRKEAVDLAVMKIFYQGDR